jgi:uncharacterized membrane protein
MQEAWLILFDQFVLIVEVIIFILEMMGMIVILLASIRSFYGYMRREDDIRLKFAMAMATGLEFKLAGEILRTVIVRDLTEIAVVASIIVLRAFMAILIHWEIKTEATAASAAAAEAEAKAAESEAKAASAAAAAAEAAAAAVEIDCRR